ncbi:mycofactocin-coupled SDR family oxidoreductase [Mycobacterium sp. DSM 3803]|nr:mycofactocin-coupled SDR family oxidoreductase [Mycobacterium sp. DSM 3803]
MGQFTGKVAFITGAGRGQGRSHAVRLATEGADLALLDLGSAGTVSHPPYRCATSEDLKETVRLCEQQGARVNAYEVDVRDYAGMAEAADDTAAGLGGIDFVIANAGITDGFYPTWEIPLENWQTMIDINLTGVFHTVKATVPHVRKRGRGGSLVLVSSNVATHKACGYLSHYVAAKIGVRSLAMALAKELGPEGIRCNSLHPAAIKTEMTQHMVDFSDKTMEELLQQFRDSQLLAVDLEPRDSTAAVVWLLSDEARYVTGLEFNVDAGDSRR